MKLKKLPYHLGLLIPISLIILNGASTYYSCIRFESETTQQCFWTAYACVWLTYAMAVFVSPGFTSGETVAGAKYVQCPKCGFPKPERAHHCKISGRCVLRMDHHCPWTENTVGFRNLPHFVRFLTTTILLNAYGVYKSAAFLIYCFEHRKYLQHFVPYRSRIWIAGVAVVGDLFVFLTLLVLWLRVIIDTMNGKTQIEVWECERMESLARRKLAPFVEFPFDIDWVSNLRAALGEPWEWFLPWGTPAGSGHVFARLPETEGRWPPSENAEIATHDFYRIDRWTSIDGDALADFGVDPHASNHADADADDDDDDIPLSQLKHQ